jgi:hypothetical protein
MTAVVEITEAQLAQLREDASRDRPPSDELAANILLARAGEATPAGLYLRRNGHWEQFGPCDCPVCTRARDGAGETGELLRLVRAWAEEQVGWDPRAWAEEQVGWDPSVGRSGRWTEAEHKLLLAVKGTAS